MGRVVGIAVLDAEQHSTPMVRLGQLGQRVAARAILEMAALRRARAYPVLARHHFAAARESVRCFWSFTALASSSAVV